LEVLSEVLLADLVRLLDPRTAKDVPDLRKNGKTNDDVEIAVESCPDDAGGRALFVEEGRNPDVRVKQNDGLHGAWFSLPHAPP
jgi:hypothetical protein